MTSLIRWDPFPEFASMRRTMDRLFDDFMTPRLWRGDGEPTFPLDLYETEDSVVVRAALPGVGIDDVDISVTDDALIIKGQVTQEGKVERENYYRRELRHGAFARTIPLPSGIDHDKAEATFENGVLTISLPKAEEARPKVIKVRAKPVVEAKS